MASCPIAGGLVPFTTIDYPGAASCVVFLRGCMYRCKYCSNPDLLSPEAMSQMSQDNWDYILTFLRKRAGLLDAVVFSGGEATLQADALIPAIDEIKKIGDYKIGLHTNGGAPDKLAALLPHIDWVGMDVKTTAENYDELTGAKNAWENVIRSLDILIASGTEFEVRTTIDPRFLTRESLADLAKFLSMRGVKNYALQRLRPVGLNEDNKSTEFFELFDADYMRSIFDNFIIRD